MTALEVWRARFGEDSLARGLSARTVASRQSQLRAFLAWLAERGVAEPAEINRAMLERYRRHLYYRRIRGGKPLSLASQHNSLTAVKVFCRYLAREEVIGANPAAEFELPRVHRRLPRAILTVAEVEAICRQCLLHGDLGIRDRAIVETFYATGIRRMELANLDLYDVDRDQGTLMVREGKGRKDRLIPIGARACAWIERYLAEVRPQLVVGNADDRALFLNERGERLSKNHLSEKMRAYVKAAGIEKPGACHLFRHTMATLMLENGADIRFIQAMLGHACIESTTIYTQVSIRALKEVYARTHPAKHVPRSRQVEAEADATAEADCSPSWTPKPCAIASWKPSAMKGKIVFGERGTVMENATAAATPKQEAHRLLDTLPSDASWEQLAYTMEVRADIEAGLADIAAGRVTPTKEVRREFGLPE